MHRCLLVLLIATGYITAADAADPDSRRIGRSQDWQTLLAEPPVKLADFPPVFLGVDRELAVVGEAVTLYAAYDLALPASEQETDGGDNSLGPFTVHCEPPRELLEDQIEMAGAIQEKLGVDGFGLFAWTKTLNTPGQWQFHVLDQHGIRMATAHVEVVAGTIARWCRLRPVPETIVAAEGFHVAFAPLPVGPGIAAHPAPPEDRVAWTYLPRAFLEHITDRADCQLPAAEPSVVRLPTRVRRGWVDLTLPIEVCDDLTTISDHLLVRWWRNGQPWEPAKPEDFPQEAQMLQEALQAVQDERVSRELRLALDWGDLPTGTPISVQFLWSQEPVRDDELMAMRVECGGLQNLDAAPTDHIVEPVLMSERLELIAP